MSSMQLIAQFGYVALFAASFLSASALPMSAAVFVLGMPPLGYNIWLVGLVAVLGGYCGGATTYYIGLKGGDLLLGKWFKVEEEKMARARQWFERWGIWVLLFAAAPVIGDALCAAAGLLHVRFWKFTAVTILSKGWHYVVILVVWKLWAGG